MKNYVLMPVALCLALGCAGEQTPSDDSTNAQASAPVAAAPAPPSAQSAAARRDDRPARRRKILFVGTSLTAGYGLDPDSAYPQLVQRMIDSAGLAYEVVNAGVSGETSASLLRRLDWLMRQPFDVIVIETGANDGLRGIAVDEMRRNITRIIERVRAARPDARIVLAQMEAPPNLGALYTRQFRRAFVEIAEATGSHLLPFLLDGVAGIRELNQGDGIHPNYEGERIVARNVWKGLRPMLQ
jgi:acyl-CoA thioesterase-1